MSTKHYCDLCNEEMPYDRTLSIGVAPKEDGKLYALRQWTVCKACVPDEQAVFDVLKIGDTQ